MFRVDVLQCRGFKLLSCLRSSCEGGSSSAGQGEKGRRLACGAMLRLGDRQQGWSLRLLGHPWFHLTIFLLSGEFLLHLHNHGWPWHSYTVQEDLEGQKGSHIFFFFFRLNKTLVSRRQYIASFDLSDQKPIDWAFCDHILGTPARWLVNLYKGIPFQDTFC